MSTDPSGRPAGPVVIGVAGGSASGKTTVVDAIVDGLGADAVSIVEHDSYYHNHPTVPLAERALFNYDHPDSLETSLLVQHLESLKRGLPVEVPTYDFTTHLRQPETRTVTPRPAVIVEGILILADARLRALMDIMVFVDTDSDIRFVRRLRRDMAERGRTMDSVIDQYLRTVRPMHIEFVEPSKRHAHVIIPEGGRNRVAVDMLITKIRSIVHGA